MIFGKYLLVMIFLRFFVLLFYLIPNITPQSASAVRDIKIAVITGGPGQRQGTSGCRTRSGAQLRLTTRTGDSSLAGNDC